MADRKIHTRGLTSFFTLFGFLIMSITGLALYVEPAGRVAYWTNWSMLGLSKDSWGNIHILSSLLFITAGAFHIYFNWRSLINYFKDKMSRSVRLRKELAITILISIWMVFSAIYTIPPLSYLIDLNNFVKDTWIVQDEYEPPFGHAELLSLASFCQKMGIDLDDAVRELKANGIELASAKETIEEIAAKNNLAPMELYGMIKKLERTPEPEKIAGYTPQEVEVEFAGSGLGNKSLSYMSEKLGLSVDSVMARLTRANITAAPDETFKKIADNEGTVPIEILKVILIEGYRPEKKN